MVYPCFSVVISELQQRLRDYSQPVANAKWQSVPVKYDMQTYELMDVYFKTPMFHARVDESKQLEYLSNQIKPNLPWADNHFLERVCGAPINPGVEWANWPYGKSAEKFLEGGQFNHNYMERYWPRFAGLLPATQSATEFQLQLELEFVGKSNIENTGIRHRYGDLNDVVRLLENDPNTRQAFLPIFFPEDTGTHHGGRVPCTLGYQFLHRSGYLHIVYYLRSCDFVRHFRDDIYLTARLLLWVLDRLRERDPSWNNVKPGMYTMHMTSLHMFKSDYGPMFNQAHPRG